MKNAIALGTFDGIHKGHKAVLSLPQEYNKTAVVFVTPPKSAKENSPCAIMTAKDKIEAIKAFGIDEVYPLEFLAVRDISAEKFLFFLKEKFSPDFISCGYNYHFGKNALGNTELLAEFCKENNIELSVKEAVKLNGEPISSTKIREYLKNGEIEKANELLENPFSFSAEVISGDERGRTLGFPTINQKYPTELVPLKFGVYKSKVLIGGEVFEGITNIGIRPTFSVDYILSETHILGFCGNLYGREIRITPYKFLRGEIKFSSIEELKNQISIDINS